MDLKVQVLAAKTTKLVSVRRFLFFSSSPTLHTSRDTHPVLYTLIESPLGCVLLRAPLVQSVRHLRTKLELMPEAPEVVHQILFIS